MIIILLQLSIGFGLDIQGDYSDNDVIKKGIIQIENECGDFKCGWWHSSRINNGFKGDPDDQNIFYIKKDFQL